MKNVVKTSAIRTPCIVSDAIVVEPAGRTESAGSRKSLKNAEDRAERDRCRRGINVRDDDAVFAAHVACGQSRYRTSILANMS